MPGDAPATTTGSPWIAHGATLAWTALVLLCLLWPGTGLPATDYSWWRFLPSGIDKAVHGLLFFMETFYLLRSLHHLRPGFPALPAAIASAILLGALTEIFQLWVPDREGSGTDLIADALGAFACGAWVSRPVRAETRSSS